MATCVDSSEDFLSVISRREMLKCLAGSTAAMLLHATQPLFAEDRYTGMSTEKYLGTARIAATVEHEKIFTEGPVADARGDIYFTNVPAQHILKYTVADKSLKVARENTNFANGLAFDAAGRLLACEGGTEDRGRVTRTDLKTGESVVLADAFEGKPLGAPNDLCLDQSGRMYFTSRSVNADKANVNSVYRIDPDGKLTRVLGAPDIDMPNGLEVTPDGKIFYLVESDGRADRARCLRRFDLQSDGTVRNGSILINFYPGRSGDGLCLDTAGNLYVAAGLHKTRGTSETLDTKPGIHVISPAGRLVGFVPTPVDTITNCAFGGPDGKLLFVTCGPHLLEIPAIIGGRLPGSR